MAWKVRVRNKLRVPGQLVENYAKGFVTGRLMRHDVIHLAAAVPFTSPLCGAQGTFHIQGISKDFSYTVCGKCLQITSGLA